MIAMVKNKWRRRLSEVKGATQQSEVGATRAPARLPGLNIEVVHRQSPDGDSEQISINLQAVPSFEAFGRFLEATNPFAFWLRASRLAWFPWLECARLATLPFSGAPALPPSDKWQRPSATLADFSRARDSQITFSVTHGWSAFWRGRPWFAERRIGETSLAVGSSRFWIGWVTRHGDKCARSTCRD